MEDFYSLCPYERRVIELLRNSKDKRARKLAKKRVHRTPSTQTMEPFTHSLFAIARNLRPRQEKGGRAHKRHCGVEACGALNKNNVFFFVRGVLFLLLTGLWEIKWRK